MKRQLLDLMRVLHRPVEIAGEQGLWQPPKISLFDDRYPGHSGRSLLAGGIRPPSLA